MEEKYNYILMTKIVEKTAYENLPLSKDLAFLLLKGINKSAYDEVDPYLHMASSLLGIQDSFQEMRFEQILGYPQLTFNRYDNYGLYEGIEEQFVVYESTLPWSDENTSVLNYIYQNKRKWELLCSVILGKLLVILDQNDKALQYVAALPAPSYIFHSYFDWIKPFVNEFIEEAKRVNYPKYSQEKIEKGTEILKNYSSLEKKLEKRQIQLETPKGQLVSFHSDYEPLIVGKTIKEVKLSEEILYKKKEDIISLSIIEYQVYAIDSNPNTFTNLAFPPEATLKNEFQSRYIHPDSSFFKMVSTYFWDESRRKKLLGKKDAEPQKEAEQPKQDQFPPYENPADDEEEVKESKNLLEEAEDTLIAKPKQTKKKNSKITIEIPGGEKPKEEYKESINYDTVESGTAKDDKNKEYPMIDLPIQEVNYIRRYVLRNDTLENLRVEIKFNNNPKDINMFYPQAMCKKVGMRTSQTLVTLLKKKRNEDWPNVFNMETYLEFTDQSKAVENISSNNFNVSNISNAKVVPFANSYPADDYAQILDDVPQPGGGMKKCHLCETENDTNAVKCSWCTAELYN